MPSTLSKKETDLIAEARHVVGRAKARFAAFKKADQGRKVKLLPVEVLNKLEAVVKKLEQLIGETGSATSEVGDATESEAKLRKKLFAALTRIRDVIKAAYPEERALARAFGAGSRLLAKSTPKLITTAETVKSAFGKAAQKKKAIDAGITAAAIKEVDVLREQLTEADTTQRTRLSTRKGAVVNKRDLLRDLQAGVARIRRVVPLAFPGQKDVLAEFATTRPRRQSKPRKPAAPSTPPTP